MMQEPLSPPDARKLAQEILAGGGVRYSKHALDEMDADGLTREQVHQVLRGGIVEPAELERGTFRYRIRAGNIMVVVAFRSEVLIIVVTAWRVR